MFEATIFLDSSLARIVLSNPLWRWSEHLWTEKFKLLTGILHLFPRGS